MNDAAHMRHFRALEDALHVKARQHLKLQAQSIPTIASATGLTQESVARLLVKRFPHVPRQVRAGLRHGGMKRQERKQNCVGCGNSYPESQLFERHCRECEPVALTTAERAERWNKSIVNELAYLFRLHYSRVLAICRMSSRSCGVAAEKPALALVARGDTRVLEIRKPSFGLRADAETIALADLIKRANRTIANVNRFDRDRYGAHHFATLDPRRNLGPAFEDALRSILIDARAHR